MDSNKKSKKKLPVSDNNIEVASLKPKSKKSKDPEDAIIIAPAGALPVQIKETSKTKNAVLDSVIEKNKPSKPKPTKAESTIQNKEIATRKDTKEDDTKKNSKTVLSVEKKKAKNKEVKDRVVKDKVAKDKNAKYKEAKDKEAKDKEAKDKVVKDKNAKYKEAKDKVVNNKVALKGIKDLIRIMERIDKGIQKNNKLLKTLIDSTALKTDSRANKPNKTRITLPNKNAKVPISFSFIIFFKKTKDENSIIKKVDKLTTYINSYLKNKAFLDFINKGFEKSHDIIPIQLETYRKVDENATYFKFNVDSPHINDSNIGRIIEKIQEKFFQAEELGWFKSFVYAL